MADWPANRTAGPRPIKEFHGKQLQIAWKVLLDLIGYLAAGLILETYITRPYYWLIGCINADHIITPSIPY
jgi:hypothetical protein